jgi:hypothetical protein
MLFTILRFKSTQMRKLILLLVTVFVSALLPQTVSAQSFYAMRQQRDLIFSFGVNSSTYYGDLKSDKDVFDLKPSLSLGAQYYFTDRIGARAELSWISLSADDSKSGEEGKIGRNLSFKTTGYEFAVTGVVNLLSQGTRYYQRPVINPYGFIGIGALYFNPKAELNGTKYALQPLQTEGVDYSRVTMIIPYGLGARVKVSPFLNVCIEAGWRKTFSDYIDDVSTVYADPATLKNDLARQLADRRWEIGKSPMTAGKKRGDPSNDDAYMLLAAKFEYYLPVRIGSGQNKLYNKKRKSYYRRR